MILAPHGLSNSMEIDVNISQHTALVKLTTFYHEQIDITVRSHRFSRGGPKKNDPLRLCHCRYALNDLIEYCLSDLGHTCDFTDSPAFRVFEQRKDSAELLVNPSVYFGQSKI
jgi:hypothetical protein